MVLVPVIEGNDRADSDLNSVARALGQATVLVSDEEDEAVFVEDAGWVVSVTPWVTSESARSPFGMRSDGSGAVDKGVVVGPVYSAS
jgi:hypothetical protein